MCGCFQYISKSRDFTAGIEVSVSSFATGSGIGEQACATSKKLKTQIFLSVLNFKLIYATCGSFFNTVKEFVFHSHAVAPAKKAPD